VTITTDVDTEAERKIPLFVYVDSERKKEVGDPRNNEDPPRLPFNTFLYGLQLESPPAIQEGFWFQIAELEIKGNHVTLSNDYIPPCLNVSSSVNLVNITQDFRNTLERLLLLTTQTFNGFSSARGLEDFADGAPLRQAFIAISQNLSIFLSSTLDEQSQTKPHHPSELILYYKKLFRLFQSLFELYPPVKSFLKRSPKSEMEDLFFTSISAFLKSDYNHEDLRSQITPIQKILQMMEEILIYIAELSPERLMIHSGVLEYRGKSYKQMDFEACKFSPDGDLQYLSIEGIKSGTIQDILILVRSELFSRDEYQYLDVRIGVNEANTLGQSDPGEVDSATVPDRIVFSFIDRMRASDIYKLNVIFRGPINYSRLNQITRSDIQVYGL
jgi:hypothetical protein